MRATLAAAALSVLTALAVISCDQAPTETFPSPSSSVAVAPSPSVLASPTTQTASPTTPNGAVDLKTHPVAVPSDFKYIESWTGRLLVLDLASGSATELATYTARAGEPGYPRADLSASADGRTLLVLVHVGPLDATLFVLTPANGQARVLARGAIDNALISADGARFAAARHDDDRGLAGLWSGNVLDGAMRRLISDDPHLVGAPPVPFAFSSDSERLAFGLGMGEVGYRVGVIAASSPEVDATRLRDASTTTPGVTLLEMGSGAEFVSATELFVWSSRSLFGGQTFAYMYDLAASKKTDLYRPSGDVRLEAAWRPNAAQFATIEEPICCGIGLPRTPWLRGRDGTAKMLDANPFIGQTWWSRDGSKLYATLEGDDSTGGVLDLMTGRSVMAFCKRGGVPPAPCT